MTTYRIPTAVSGSVILPIFGNIDFAYDAGTVTPSDEKDAAVLAHLASISLADVTSAATKPKTTAVPAAASDTKTEE